MDEFAVILDKLCEMNSEGAAMLMPMNSLANLIEKMERCAGGKFTLESLSPEECAIEARNWKAAFADEFQRQSQAYEAFWSSAIGINPRYKRKNGATRAYEAKGLTSLTYRVLLDYVGQQKGFVLHAQDDLSYQDLADLFGTNFQFDIYIYDVTLEWSLVFPHEVDFGPLFFERRHP